MGIRKGIERKCMTSRCYIDQDLPTQLLLRLRQGFALKLNHFVNASNPPETTNRFLRANQSEPRPSNGFQHDHLYRWPERFSALNHLTNSRFFDAQIT